MTHGSVAANGGVTCGTEVGLGDITAVNPGTGLSGGGATGAVTLGVDTTVIQSRVTGTCATGTYITAIAQNGAVTCGTEVGDGDITGVTAGTGLTGGGASGTVTLGIANNGVTAAQIADGAVTMAKTSAPIGTSVIVAPSTSSINGGTVTSFSTGNAFTADTNGTCMLTAWAASVDGQFWMQPVLRVGAAGAPILSNAYVPSSPASDFLGYTHVATATGSVAVTAGTSYQVGCLYGNSGFNIGTPACRVNWVCN